MVIGTCCKCGKVKEVRHHHYKGYGTDETLPYCRSCDQKEHIKARKDGTCKLNHNEVNKLSGKSYERRIVKTLSLSSVTIGKNITLREILHLNTNTGNIVFSSYFNQGYNTKLYTIYEVKK